MSKQIFKTVITVEVIHDEEMRQYLPDYNVMESIDAAELLMQCADPYSMARKDKCVMKDCKFETIEIDKDTAIKETKEYMHSDEIEEYWGE